MLKIILIVNFFLFIFTEEKASETESEDDYDEQDVDEIFELDDEPIKRRSDDDDDEDDPALNPLADSSGSLIWLSNHNIRWTGAIATEARGSMVPSLFFSKRFLRKNYYIFIDFKYFFQSLF